MKDCVFCKIVNGKEPADKVYEDERFLAFLDKKAWVRGHTLVIPKKHYRWVIDVPEFGEYWEIAKKVGLGLKAGLGAKTVNFKTIGEIVYHAHIHVVPEYEGGPVKESSEEIGKKIAKAIK